MKKFDENGGFAVPKLTVMPPRVINVDNVPSLESVASQEIKYSPVTDASRDGSKCNFRHDDECGVMFDPYKDQIKGYTKDRVVDGYAQFTSNPSEQIPDTCCGIYDSEQGVVIQKIDTVEDGR